MRSKLLVPRDMVHVLVANGMKENVHFFVDTKIGVWDESNNKTPEGRARISKAAKSLWQNPVFRAKMIARQKELGLRTYPNEYAGA